MSKFHILHVLFENLLVSAPISALKVCEYSRSWCYFKGIQELNWRPGAFLAKRALCLFYFMLPLFVI